MSAKEDLAPYAVGTSGKWYEAGELIGIATVTESTGYKTRLSIQPNGDDVDPYNDWQYTHDLRGSRLTDPCYFELD